MKQWSLEKCFNAASKADNEYTVDTVQFRKHPCFLKASFWSALLGALVAHQYTMDSLSLSDIKVGVVDGFQLAVSN